MRLTMRFGAVFCASMLRASYWLTLISAVLAQSLRGHDESADPSRLTVDVGYATYRGSHDADYGLNTWKSIRYAAAPTGKRRWQAPSPPIPSKPGHITSATVQPPICPQTGAFGTPEIYGFNTGPGDEDCLYLNIWSKEGAANLPVLFWIHGGGYSDFGASYSPRTWMKNNGNGFVFVEIQYRLGAFGYLSSAEVQQRGQLNAGLLDMRFALRWVQQHIRKFGGDPKKVTVAGESSGAGSAMYQALAYGGREGHLFNNIIAASPYIPATWNFDDPTPEERYDLFVKEAGCAPGTRDRKKYPIAFDCLVAADSEMLQNASGTVSTTNGYFGTFAFLPVVDGKFIQQRPSEQLARGKVSGKRLLVGNNANEGVPPTNPNVTTLAAYESFISTTFPDFTPKDRSRLARIYKVSGAAERDSQPHFDTLGVSGPTALRQSGMATGLQQTVFAIAAETTFVCPAQWLAEAYSLGGRSAWKYQYSVTPSYHGADLAGYFSEGADVPNADFSVAFQKILGEFVMFNNPRIDYRVAIAGFANATVPEGGNGKLAWPKYTLEKPKQMDLNTTGGVASLVVVNDELQYYVRQGEGIVNTFRVVNAASWEGGRGERCEFWRRVSARVPQ